MPLSSWKEHYWYTVPVIRSRIEEIVLLANAKGKRVLEIGCNEGFLSQALVESGADVLSADIDPTMVEKARTLFGLDAIVADVRKLPFPDQHFDVVVSGETLEHVMNPFEALAELFRVTKERLVVSLPVGEYWLGERTHQWQIDGSILDHDSKDIHKIGDQKRNVLVLVWNRKRDQDYKDIPPFDTGETLRKYRIA